MRAATAPRPVVPPAEPGPAPVPAAVGLPGRAHGPRRLWLTGLLLVVVIAACATVAAVSIAGRSTELRGMVDRTEPLATAAENLYAALSRADADAASGFLSVGQQGDATGSSSAGERTVYAGAVADAGAALGTAASGVTAASPESTRTALTLLVTDLPVYTGLVETARANNQLGLPVGAAYLREASNLMRTTLLPAAETLYAEQSAAVTAAQDAAGGLPVTAVAMAVVIVLALLAGTVVLAAATHRRLNPGLVVALLATLGWAGWLVVAGAAAARDLHTSRTDGSQPLTTLVAARIVAQQARTDEKLYLIARGSGAANEKDFGTHAGQLSDLLQGALGDPAGVDVSGLRADLTAWVQGHQQMFATGDGGDYPAAVQLSAGTLDTRFGQLDQRLQAAVDTVRQTLRDRAESGDAALAGLSSGILGLAGLAALAVLVGLAPRLREFQ